MTIRLYVQAEGKQFFFQRSFKRTDTAIAAAKKHSKAYVTDDSFTTINKRGAVVPIEKPVFTEGFTWSGGV